MGSGFLVDASSGVLKEGSGRFFGGRHGGMMVAVVFMSVTSVLIYLSLDTAGLFFWRVLHFLLAVYYNSTTTTHYCQMTSKQTNNISRTDMHVRGRTQLFIVLCIQKNIHMPVNTNTRRSSLS